MSKEPFNLKMDLLKTPRIQKMGVSMTSLKSTTDDDDAASGLGYQNTLVSIFFIYLIDYFKPQGSSHELFYKLERVTNEISKQMKHKQKNS